MSPEGDRRRRRGAWVLVGLLVVAAVVLAEQPPARADPPGRGGCQGGPAGILGCAPISGRLVGAVAEAAGNTIMAGVTGWFTDAAGWFVRQVGELLVGTSRPQLTAGWWVGKYRLLLAFGVVVASATLLLAIVDAAAKGSWEGLAQALGIDVPAAAVAGSAAPVLVQYLVDVADWLSGRLLADFAANGTTTLSHAAQWFTTFGTATATPAQPLFLGVVVALLTILAGLLVVVELLLRANAIYLVTALVPLVYAMRVWPALRPVARKTTELLVALVFAQPLVALAVTFGAAAGASLGGLGDAALADFGTALAGGVMLLLAALAPWAVMGLLPVLEAGMAAHRQRAALTAGPRGAIQTVYVGSYLGRLTQVPRGRTAGTAAGWGGPAMASTQAVRMAAQATAAHATRTGVAASRGPQAPPPPSAGAGRAASDDRPGGRTTRPPSSRGPGGDR